MINFQHIIQSFRTNDYYYNPYVSVDAWRRRRRRQHQQACGGAAWALKLGGFGGGGHIIKLAAKRKTGKLNGGGRRGHIIKLAAQRWSGEAHWWRRWRRWRQQAYKRSLQWRDWGAKTLRRRRQQPRQGLRDEVSFYFFSCLWCLLLSLLSSPVLPPRPFFVSIFLLLFSTFFICRYF